MRNNGAFDVVIVGGGPAGSVAALVLQRTGQRVLLLEAGGKASFKIGETLPPACRPLLRDLGLWDRVTRGAHHVCPGNVASWGGPDAKDHDFIRDPNGSGWHLDRPTFDADLRASVREAGGDVWESCRARRWKFDLNTHHWTIWVSKNSVQSAVVSPWLIDATGRRASLSTTSGAKSYVVDQLTAYAVLLPTSVSDTDQRTWIESEPNGWFYSALLPRHRRMIAYFTDKDLWPLNAWHGADDLLRRIAKTNHLRKFLDIHTKMSRPRLYRFPACTILRTASTGQGWLALGDATLVFDPLSSQGIFHALYTGLRGAEAIICANNGGGNALVDYEQRIQSVTEAYLSHRLSIYRSENRWQSNAFWHRRQSATVRGDSPQLLTKIANAH